MPFLVVSRREERIEDLAGWRFVFILESGHYARFKQQGRLN